MKEIQNSTHAEGFFLILLFPQIKKQNTASVLKSKYVPFSSYNPLPLLKSNHYPDFVIIVFF